MALTEAGLSENSAAILAGIPRQTFRRRLVTGDFTFGELGRVANILGTTASRLVALAEKSAA
jgi:hypothetical protein